MEDINDLMNDDVNKKKDAKWNLFDFQNHILAWIKICSLDFYNKNYVGAFEALQNLYIDTNGFLEEEEKTKMSKLWNEAYLKSLQYNSYDLRFQDKVLGKAQKYQPPTELYFALLTFRFELMKALCEHQLLIPIINKSQSGVASL